MRTVGGSGFGGVDLGGDEKDSIETGVDAWGSVEVWECPSLLVVVTEAGDVLPDVGVGGWTVTASLGTSSCNGVFLPFSMAVNRGR